MEKICPYCNNELELGYMQSRDSLSWTNKKCFIAALSSLSSSALVLTSGQGLFSSGVIKAYRCSVCKLIIIDYGENND